MALTYKDFKTKLRRTIWVTPGEPSNLIAAHNIFFNEAMVEIAKWCFLNRQNNTSVINACKTLVRCGLTVFDSPPTVDGPGVIRRVYTIANNEWCDFVYFEKSTMRDIQCWSRRLCGYTAPLNVGLPALQQGFRYAEAATDSPYGRGRIGLWAEERKRIYIAPWIQSNEKVIVEWDGWKQDWQDDDIVDEVIWGADIQAAIRTYVRWKHEDTFGCDLQKKRDLYSQFYGDGRDVEGELANLMYWDKSKREGDSVEDCSQRYLPTKAELDDDVVEEAPGATSFAIIGDFGEVGTAPEQVATMVKSWNPEFIVSAGDNWYGSTNTREDLDLKVGRLYADYIGNYSGAYGNGASRQNFYAAIGDHDRDPVGRLDLELDYFGFAALQDLSNGEIRPFYSVVRGPLHIFVVDCGFDQSDVNQQTKYGNTPSSAQAQWLRISLLLSTARWKMVVLGAAPYTSFHSGHNNPPFTGDGFKAYSALQWPFKQWGADVVISGDIHWYERLEVDGLPYITNGAGGSSIFTQANPLSPYTKFIYDGDFGAQKCSVDCNTLQMDFYSRLGVLKESFKLTKD